VGIHAYPHGSIGLAYNFYSRSRDDPSRGIVYKSGFSDTESDGACREIAQEF